MIAFGLWYWDLDRGGAAARALGTGTSPAFVFPEMSNPELVRDSWYPSFVDYLHLSYSTSMAFSPTDVSAIKPWAKLMMMAEETISLVVGILVVARAVNILKLGQGIPGRRGRAFRSVDSSAGVRTCPEQCVVPPFSPDPTP
jgi:hypothetical protein